MYLIWRMDTTAKGAKKNTSPNVIHFQYLKFCSFSLFCYYMYLPFGKGMTVHLNLNESSSDNDAFCQVMLKFGPAGL